jgi:hypothetical protein
VELIHHRGVTARRQEEEVLFFARNRYMEEVRDVWELSAQAADPVGQRQLEEEWLEVEARAQAEATAVGNEAARRWSETGTLPKFWPGFSENLGNIGVAEAQDTQNRAFAAIEAVLVGI